MPFSIGSFIKFDPSKLDKAALKTWLISGFKLLEPSIVTPGNIDKYLFDNLETMLGSLINQFVEEASNGGKLVVGEVASSESDVDAYLNTFGSVPAETREILRGNPRLVRRLQRFSADEQKMIVGNPFLLLALQTLLPFLFELLLNKLKD